jgi:hypothetical protein
LSLSLVVGVRAAFADLFILFFQFTTKGGGEFRLNKHITSLDYSLNTLTQIETGITVFQKTTVSF